MPPRQEKTRKVVNTGPSPSLMERLFGQSEMGPNIQEGIDIARRENPNLAPVQSYGPLSRLLLPQAQGYTSPGRNIYLNPAQLEGFSPEDVADTIIHEQTHVNQMGPSSIMNFFKQFGNSDPYHQRPEEIEAFQAEQARRSRQGRLQTGMPEFSTGNIIAPQDIMLPAEKGIKVGPSARKR